MAAVLFVSLFTGCAKKTEEAAVVNGVKISLEDLEYEIASLPPQYKAMAQNPEMKKRILDNLVIAELLLQEAKKTGILDKDEVKTKIKDQEKNLVADAEEQMAALKNQKAKAASIAQREIVIREVLGSKNFAEMQVDESEIKTQYKNYADNMKSQDPNAKVEKYEVIKDDIKSSIARQKWVDGLKTGAEIKINESALGAPNMFMPQGNGIQLQGAQ